MANLAFNELNETEKKLLVITRQDKSILRILLLYIFIQNITNVHTYIHIYKLFTRFLASCVSPQSLLFKCIALLFLLTRAGALRKVDAMVAFTSPLPRLYLRNFMTAGRKEQ